MKFGANNIESRRKALANTENLSVRITITTSYSRLSLMYGQLPEGESNLSLLSQVSQAWDLETIESAYNHFVTAFHPYLLWSHRRR